MDCFLSGEQWDTVNLVKEYEQARRVQSEATRNVRRAVAEAYPRAYRVVQTAKAQEVTKAAKKKRWQAEFLENPSAVVLRDAPQGAYVLKDDFKGRYRVAMKPMGPKSLSWTIRGHDLAARMVLKQLRDWHVEKNGVGPVLGD